MTILIQLTNINLNFGERVLYENLNWQVPDGTHAALVGNNGTGKTTLLRIIRGEVEPDSGSVVVPKNISYLAQDLSENLDANVKLGQLFHTDDGYENAARAGRVLKGLGFLTHAHINDVLERHVGEFSGGWKMRLQLASVLLSLDNEPSSLLLLDEPTNHLDTESLEWLESWLSSYRGTLIAIAHDRRFLDKLCPLTAELANKKLVLWRGNYSYYKEESAKRARLLLQTKKTQDTVIQKTERFIEKFRAQATKASQVQSRIKSLEKIERVELDAPPPAVSFRFPETSPSGYEVARAENVSKAYPPISVFRSVSFSITRGQKIALVGANGSGKSTLSRLISGVEEPSNGKIRLGEGVKCAFYLQESAQNLDYSKTIMEEISLCGKINESEKRNLLGAFLFRGEDILKRIGVLSGGEKSRLALLKILLGESNFLILDEPTNHLDVTTREIFQRALIDYSGTLLLVSHDRNFLDSLATRVLEIREERLYDYPGNYSYFIEKRASQLQLQNEKIDSIKPLTKTALRQSKKDVNEQKTQENAHARKIMLLESEINLRERELKNCDSRLCQPEKLSGSEIQELMRTRNKIETDLENLLSQWERLQM